MDETLSNVVARLSAMTNYPSLFAAAFDSREITAEKIGLALEQFVLTLTSFDAKFDRVLRGEDSFTAEEQSGFVLFTTEYDPRRAQFGADCFHCHGGPLFQSHGARFGPRKIFRSLLAQRGVNGAVHARRTIRDAARSGRALRDRRAAQRDARSQPGETSGRRRAVERSGPARVGGVFENADGRAVCVAGDGDEFE